MEALLHKENKIDFKFTKVKTKFCLSLHYNADNSYLFVNGKDVCEFKASNKNIVFHVDFVLEPYPPTNLSLLIYVKYLFRIFQLIINLLMNLEF